MKNNSPLYDGNYKKWGGTVGVKFLVGKFPPVVPIKHLYLRLSKAFLVDFEAAEDIINSISAGRGQYSDYLQTIYNFIQKLLKGSIIL